MAELLEAFYLLESNGAYEIALLRECDLSFRSHSLIWLINNAGRSLPNERFDEAFEAFCDDYEKQFDRPKGPSA